MFFKNLAYLCALFFLTVQCSPKEMPLSEEYIAEIKEWKESRDIRLRAENGFVNLVGLHWLKEGSNSFGSSETNDVIFPEGAPMVIGNLTLNDSVVTFIGNEKTSVIIDSIPSMNATVYDVVNGVKPIMQHENFKWFIIERAGNIGVRLRDLELPATKEPLNIPSYPLDKNWIITAKYEAYNQPVNQSIDNIIGFSFDEEIKGRLVFEIDGKNHSLLPLMDEDDIFIMFGDETSGIDTYGAGRYLVADLPNEKNEVILDFNRAYNPPCAFTDYATCPLPPASNILKIDVTAGEKYKAH